MASNTAKIKFRTMAFVDRPGVIRRISRWKLGQLARAGAYARGAMKNQIRPQTKAQRQQVVVIIPTPNDMPPGWRGPPPARYNCIVSRNFSDWVINADTFRLVPLSVALKARVAAFRQFKGMGEGKPPRRGRRDILRQNIFSKVDVNKESVVIGPEPFPRQPAMQGRVSVPELLNKGGVELIAGTPVRFGPRPYVETILPKAIARLKQNITKKPISA